MTQETRRTVPRITGTEIVALLKQGFTRFAADDCGFGSIEVRYNLTPAGVRRLFQNESLKGLKTSIPEFEFVDDLPAEEIEVDTFETAASEIAVDLSQRLGDIIAQADPALRAIEEAVVGTTRIVGETRPNATPVIPDVFQ